MGTPEFAVPCLEAMVHGGLEVVGVFTQPDRPKGRGNKLAASPVKEAALKAADAVYADLASKYENAIEYANFMRARVNGQMDPDSKLGLAKPYYEKLIELIEPRAEKDATERARIIEAYRYMIGYNFVVKEDKAAAKAFASKLQAIDPENEIAKQVLEAK